MLSAIRCWIFVHTTVSHEFNLIYHAEFWAAAAPLHPPPDPARTPMVSLRLVMACWAGLKLQPPARLSENKSPKTKLILDQG